MHKILLSSNDAGWDVALMKHYVQYHNAEGMGYSCDKVDSFSIMTDKVITDLPGNMLWLINGEGKPKRYSLCASFIVNKVRANEPLSGFKYFVSGETGTFFRPQIPLNRLSWYKEFVKDYQNFSLGLREIKERKYIRELEELTVEIEGQKVEESLRFGAGFGDPETNRRVERAAVSFVTNWYKARGWSVLSVEAEKCGYDLLCKKDAIEEHIEVKGIQAAGVSFIITSGEVRQARGNPLFMICVVTSALSDKPQMLRFTGDDFIKKFDLEPLSFRASLQV